jgi:tRNA 2-selenouridine synthase
MSLTVLEAGQVLSRLQEFDSIVDARSPAEFALDHLPGAVNWPTLNNEERAMIGTMFKQVSAFEAKKSGAALAARNIAGHIERGVLGRERDWRPLAYCWRGGKRSASLALVLDQIGFRVTLLEGGYKAFRAAMLQDLCSRVASLNFRVLCGPTGSGKTRLLRAMSNLGAQVLDLEELARHRSSVLGAIPDLAQPSQKRFDSLIWDTLRRFSTDRPIYIECESRKVGNVCVPATLVEKIRTSPCLRLNLPIMQRVALLLEDYAFYTADVQHLCERLDVLADFRGRATVQAWKSKALNGNFSSMVEDLLTQHYDPGYEKSMLRNFPNYANASEWSPESHSKFAMQELAGELLKLEADN